MIGDNHRILVAPRECKIPPDTLVLSSAVGIPSLVGICADVSEMYTLPRERWLDDWVLSKQHYANGTIVGILWSIPT